MERNLCLCLQENTTIGELLSRYHKEMIQAQRIAKSTAYMAKKIDTHLVQLVIHRLTPQKISQYRDTRLKDISSASLKGELSSLRSICRQTGQGNCRQTQDLPLPTQGPA
jgi:hypothetical protein